MEELLLRSVVASWKLTINRLDAKFKSFNEEQLQKPIAPDRNRVIYLFGHLTGTHDRMLPLLGIGKSLYPELYSVYGANPDRALPDPLSASDLKKAWSEVNAAATFGIEHFSVEDWLEKHAAVSDEDFAKDRTRNRLSVVLNRTNHGLVDDANTFVVIGVGDAAEHHCAQAIWADFDTSPA
jgi:hypothetical protein